MVYKTKPKIVIVNEKNEDLLAATYVFDLVQIYGQEHIYVFQNASKCAGAYLTTDNAYFLSNSLFYSNACFVGKELAHRLIVENCHAAIAYEDEVNYLPSYENYFVECENFGIIHFLNSRETLELSMSKMIDYYNVKIDELHTMNFIAASLLTNNRDNLIILGDEQLAIMDFIKN